VVEDVISAHITLLLVMFSMLGSCKELLNMMHKMFISTVRDELGN
jgi:hypothetical protein